MAINKQIKSLTEEIESSYGTRVAAVFDLARETHQTLENFNRERKKMATDLRRSLAASRASRASQVQKMRTENRRALKDMAKELDELLSASEKERRQSEKERRKQFTTLIEEIKGAIAVLEKDTAKTLADLRSDHEEMAKTLKLSLSRETKERIHAVHNLLSHFTKEHKEMADALRSGISSFRKDLTKTVDDMMDDFSADHRQARIHWENLTRVMAAKRGGRGAGFYTAIVISEQPSRAKDQLTSVKQPPAETPQVADAEKAGTTPLQSTTKSHEPDQEAEPKRHAQPHQGTSTQPLKAEQASQKSATKEHRQTKPTTDTNASTQQQ
jgi:hypothetical protein